MLNRNLKKGCLLFIIAVITLAGCKKFTTIDAPTNSIVGNLAFKDDASANASVNGIYATLSSSSLLNSNATAYLGLSSDELVKTATDKSTLQLYNNNLTADNEIVASIWRDFYRIIGLSNACLSGLASSTGVSAANKTVLTGEAKFMRALSYFHLVNLYGDVPLLISYDWQKTSIMSRTPQAQVYAQIIQDLKDAQIALPAINKSGDVIHATKWAATGLLARVYLYQQNWAAAEQQATAVINSTQFNVPLPPLAEVFLINSPEAIFQIQPPGLQRNPADWVIFYNYGSIGYIVSDELVNAFEAGDERMNTWMQGDVFSGQAVYYPYKYTGDAYTGTPIEYCMVLRLSEQFLIRAEARARLNDISGAADDLNIIRARAGLADLSPSLTQDEAVTAVEKERQVELFAEWGHRWFDLKRTPGVNPGNTRANEVLAGVKGANWRSTDMLYPIPQKERKLNINLTQNAGY